MYCISGIYGLSAQVDEFHFKMFNLLLQVARAEKSILMVVSCSKVSSGISARKLMTYFPTRISLEPRCRSAFRFFKSKDGLTAFLLHVQQKPRRLFNHVNLIKHHSLI